jgi:putative ABC transport system permease protein
MNRRNQSYSNRLFRMMLRILPFDFRRDFGGEMEEVFHEQRAGIESEGGKIGVLRLWWETLLGILRTAPREHLAILRQDAGYALRMMRANLGYTVVALATLALGIGANTAIFSIIHGILLQPLPYPQGQQLVVLRQQAPKTGASDVSFSVKEIADYRSQNHTLSALVEYHTMTFTLLGHGEAERVRTGVVSAGFFDFFGVKPVLGRTFLPSDEEHGAPGVLVLSYEYWQRSQHGDPDIVGKTFEMNDRVHTVIGVLPSFPQYPNENDLYMPTSACPYRSSQGLIEDRDQRMMSVFGRLKPGTTLEQSQADIAAIAGRLRQEYPKSYPDWAGYTATSSSLQEELTHQARPTLYVLLGAAGFVLLIACANVANLTLARMVRRERELAIRTAMGADKARLFRQLLTESSILGLLAGTVGLLLAFESRRLLVDFAARLSPRALEIHIDAPAVIFALVAAIGTSIMFGTLSALDSRPDLGSGLKEGSSQSTAGRRRRRARSVLIVCQVAFSLVLLIGAGLMVRSLIKLQSVDPGFVPQRVLTMGVNLNWSRYKTSTQLRQVVRQLLQRTENLPGVLSAAVGSSFPLDPDSIAMGPMLNNFEVDGQPEAPGQPAPLADLRRGTVDYFRTLGIPLLQGRTFAETDNDDAPGVAVVNRSFARRLWPNEDPIGKRLKFGHADHWTTVIGVVGDVKEFGLDKKVDDEIYLSMAQEPAVGSLLLRTTGDPLTLANAARRVVHELDPQTAITNLETLEQARSETLASPRVTTQLLGLFAVLALVIAATGIGGILALSVSQRVHEIGIRVALGADSFDVLRMIVGQGMSLVLLGAVLGLAGALALTRLLRALLFGVTPTDPVTFAGVALLLLGTALLACYIPARRATRIDPLTALRCE